MICLHISSKRRPLMASSIAVEVMWIIAYYSSEVLQELFVSFNAGCICLYTGAVVVRAILKINSVIESYFYKEQVQTSASTTMIRRRPFNKARRTHRSFKTNSLCCLTHAIRTNMHVFKGKLAIYQYPDIEGPLQMVQRKHLESL